MPSYQPTKTMKTRLTLPVSMAVLAVTFILITNLFTISVTKNDYYSAMANDNQFRSTTVEANRGSIFDSSGKILAQSATVYDVILNPYAITGVPEKNMPQEKKDRQIKEVALILSEELGKNYEDIVGVFRNEETMYRKYYRVSSKVEKQKVTEIFTRAEEAGLPRNLLDTEENTKRYYPQGELAAAVIGFTNYDGDGIYGVEAYYNDYLAGVDGKIISANDAQGNEMPYKNDKIYAAKDGNSIYLTIDETLQHYCERELAKCVEQNNVDNRACAIIMNAKTGAILAMATSPGFDLNDRGSIYAPKDKRALDRLREETEDEEAYNEKYAELREKQWKNKAITELYEPGSVFKVVTGSSALEEKVIDLNSTFNCTGVMQVADWPIHCWTTGAHGTQDFITAMTNSCNPAFIQVGQRLGIKKFCEYFRAYGFTEPTGIDLPGEASGLYVADPDKMGIVELASSSFGQSNSVTPIQMITAYAAVINGGYLLQPYVVSKIVDTNGNIIKTKERTVRRQVISEETSETMRHVLESVVNNNGGSNTYIKGYRIGGKSGTSQKLQKNKELGVDYLYVGSYVGFAPANDPEIIMLCMVDEPLGRDHNGAHVYYGSLVAAPVISAVFKDALPYLGYYPEYTEEELAALDVKVPSVEGQTVEAATETIENLELKYHVIGDGERVVAQVPSRSSSIPRNGTVVLYTEEDYEVEYTTVPNVLGCTVSQANQFLSEVNINFKAGDGATEHAGATAYSQNYEEGDRVPVGTVVEVSFRVKSEG